MESSYGINFMEAEGILQELGGMDMAILYSCDHMNYGVGMFGFRAADIREIFFSRLDEDED